MVRRRSVAAIAAVGMLLVTGCCLGEEAPSAGGAPPAPAPPAVAVTQVDPAAETTPAPAQERSRLAELVGEDLAARTRTKSQALDDAENAAEFAQAYRVLRMHTGELSLPLQKWFDASDGANMVPDEVFAEVPVFQVGYEAEGTAVVVYLTYPPLQERARATPEETDDTYLAMLELLYSDANAQGWSHLEQRDWDYGGCSPLGSGLHLKILLAADAALAEGDLFAPEIAAAREVVLEDILEDDDLFPYCGVVEGTERTPEARLREEVQQILDQVQLSDEERTQLEQRQRTAFGAPAESGGEVPRRQQPRRGGKPVPG